MFMAQTGAFSVPLKCTVKRCIVSDFLSMFRVSITAVMENVR